MLLRFPRKTTKHVYLFKNVILQFNAIIKEQRAQHRSLGNSRTLLKQFRFATPAHKEICDLSKMK
jgi:hypothetical protein